MPLSDPDAVIRELEALYDLPGLDIDGVFQHFAVADSTDPEAQPTPIGSTRLFRRVLTGCRRTASPQTVHCSNSAAQLRHPEWPDD